MKKRIIPILLLLLLWFFACPLISNATANTITGIIFEDTNQNGVQDAGEAGISDVNAYLLDCTNNVSVQKTNNYGVFSFDQLQDGYYAVYIFNLMGWVTTPRVVMVSTPSDAAMSVSFGIKEYPAPEPAPPPDPQPDPHPLGDVNNDGQVNALDITKVERFIAGLD